MLQFLSRMPCTPKDDAYETSGAVRDFVEWTLDRLGEEWTIKVDAFDGDVDDPRHLSAALTAHSVNGLVVTIIRHLGRDAVLVSAGSSEPVPFEDLAVILGVLDLDDMLEAGSRAIDDLPTESLVPLENALDLIRQRQDELPDLLKDRAKELRGIADKMEALLHKPAT